MCVCFMNTHVFLANSNTNWFAARKPKLFVPEDVPGDVPGPGLGCSGDVGMYHVAYVPER